MRKQFLFLTAMFVVLAVASYAQSTSSSSSQSSNPDTSMQSGSSAGTNASSSSQSASDQSSSVSSRSTNLRGCIIRQETDYFIQPVKGSRVRLNGGSEDLSQYVGKNVDVHGRWNPYNNNNENNHQATTQPSGAPITGAASTGEGTGQLFLVTRVDKIADTCPTGTPGNTSNPQ